MRKQRNQQKEISISLSNSDSSDTETSEETDKVEKGIALKTRTNSTEKENILLCFRPSKLTQLGP